VRLLISVRFLFFHSVLQNHFLCGKCPLSAPSPSKYDTFTNTCHESRTYWLCERNKPSRVHVGRGVVVLEIVIVAQIPPLLQAIFPQTALEKQKLCTQDIIWHTGLFCAKVGGEANEQGFMQAWYCCLSSPELKHNKEQMLRQYSSSPNNAKPNVGRSYITFLNINGISKLISVITFVLFVFFSIPICKR
jgi:hypothetical protein